MVSSVIQIAEATSIALHSMVFIARANGMNVTVRELVSKIGFSHAHSSKVLQQLVRAGLLQSVRGPKGGFRLCRPAGDITLLEVWEAMEGHLAVDMCIVNGGREECPFGQCILDELPGRLSEEFREYLGSRTLAGVVNQIMSRAEKAAINDGV